jgi:Tfp pilus assembly protein PilO
MSENVFFATLFVPIAAVVLILFMKYLSAVLQARARLAQDDAYREIAAKATAAQAGTAAALASVSAALADIQSRLAAVEKVLTEVE